MLLPMKVAKRRIPKLSGSFRVDGDKSIAQRLVLIAALAKGSSTIEGFPMADDPQSTLRVVRQLGVMAERKGTQVRIEGGIPEIDHGEVSFGRSGTGIRLATGVMSGRKGSVTLTGDEQLMRRPMGRVASALSLLGADVMVGSDGRGPIRVRGRELKGARVELPIASAQLKSAVLLAGLQAEGETVVVEPMQTRDHTERILEELGVAIVRHGREIRIKKGEIAGFTTKVPGDISSAAFPLAAAAILPGSRVEVSGVSLNPTRTAFLEVLSRMGAKAVYHHEGKELGEPFGTIAVSYGELRSVVIGPSEVPALIDELPLLAIVASQAAGVTEIRGASELRVKESDRIRGIVTGLRALGVEAEELEDGFRIEGGRELKGGVVDAQGDHRLAMSFLVAGLVSTSRVRVIGLQTIDDSYPGFLATLMGLGAKW